MNIPTQWLPRQRGILGGRLAAVLSLLLLGPAAFAQLSGAYTINSAAATGGTNYASFTDAATALNSGGVSGPVTFTVSGGPYTEQISLNQLTGSSATNRVTFNGGGRTIQFGSNTSAQRGVITLNGADYITINNLVIDATEAGTSTSTYGWGVHVLNNADNNVISNCTVTTNTASTSSNYAGIVSSGSTTSATGTGTTTSQNLTVEGNTVTGGYYGITAIGNSTTAPNPGIIVRNNNVREFYFYGIYTSYTTGIQIVGNDVARPTRTAVSSYYGVYLTTGVVGAAVEKNRLHQAFSASATSTSGAYGVYLTTGTAATTANAPNVVANNLVYDLDGNGIVYGLYNGSSGNSRYYYNTVSLDDQTNTSSSTTYGFYQTTGLGVEFKNNIVKLTRSGTGTNYAIYLSSATGTTVSDYNDLVVGSGSNYLTGYYAGTPYATLANWRTANGGVYDQNSTDAAPQFVSTTNLRPTASALNGTATPLARITDDITGATRNATAPDMGAYEFTPPAADVALLSIDSPASPVLPGTRAITVTIRNNGADPLTSVRLEYVLNGAAAVVQNFTLTTPLASGATQAVTFSTQGTVLTGANTLTVTASLPNGQPDANPVNNSLSSTFYTALSGTYTINKNAATGGTNFASFSDAATALNAAGIAASVRLNVLNGPYAEQFALSQVPGVSATDTIVVDGGAAKQTLTYTGTVSQPAAVLLNGTDYVTIQNLTIDASAGATYGIGVHLVGQANAIRVRGCVVMGPAAATSSTANAAVAASGSIASATSAGDANGLRLENNVLSGGYYCVVVTGTSAASRSTGVRVTGNEIRDFYLYGLDVENSAGARLLDNNIHRSTRAAVSTFYGLYLTGNVGMAAERNRVHDAFTGNPTSTSAAYGVYMTANDGLAGQENDVVNNLFYNFNGSGTEYAFYNSSSDYARYYHNTVVLDNQAYNGTLLSYGLYQTTLATGIDFQNNLLSITRSGSGNRYALYFVTTTSTITSNYNDLYLGTGATFFTGRFGTVNYAGLADWRTANGNAYDANSVAVNPQLTAPASGNLQPTAISLDNLGNPALLTRVPRDFANVLRTTPPDMGALEFAPVTNDVALVSIDAPTTPAVPGSNPVTVTIRNGGTATLTSVTLSYALNGGTPVTQLFTGLTLAPASNQQLTFTQGVVAPSGSNTLTVTASLPNGQPDGNAANNSQTITFTQPIPNNDEPCTAIALGAAPVAGSNSGATTSIQNGIPATLPACAGGQLPKDVWFSFVPAGTSTTLTLTGTAAGAVRVFSSPSCSAGLFAQVFCQGSGANNTAFTTPVVVAGLVAGTRYYVAVSGYASSDTQGSFTIAASNLLATRGSASAALSVFPNPSASGQLTLRLAAGLASAGTVELLNALGQVVQAQPLAGSAEQQLSTRGLVPGLYTLRVRAAGEVLTRKVVLQ